jgi:Zn-dependent protease
MSALAEFSVWYLVFVFSTTCHEAAHALIARKGGDDTAYALGHVTLNPVPHIQREPFGMVIVPILSFLQLGWLMGWASVPYDPHWGARHPKRRALMSLAGPMTNFLLAGISLGAILGLAELEVFSLSPSGTRVGLVWLPPGYELNSALGAAGLALSAMLRLNLILGIYNLIPVPPLDGAAVVEGFQLKSVQNFYQAIRANPSYQMLGLLVTWMLFPYIAEPAQSALGYVLYS